MAKLTLDTVPSGYLTATKYNSNNDLIEAAIEKTLSRDGTTPNNMEAELDMDSHKITNLGAPAAANDAARWVDVTDAVSLTGTAVPALTGNSQKYLGTDGSTLGWKNFYDQTSLESAASVTPTDYRYPPGDIRRYGTVGTSDDSVVMQSCVDANKGGLILIPEGITVTAAGILLSGSTYNNTSFIVKGTFKLKTRPSAVTNNFGGSWVGLILKDCDNITVEMRDSDGNRSAQPDEEHCHILGIAGASNVKVPYFYCREIKGDGIYISQSDWTSNTTDPTNIVLGEIYGTNSADDGRNLVSIISVHGLTINSLYSNKIGAVVGGVRQPGGLDIEPSATYHTVKRFAIGTVNVTTAGTQGFQIYGKSVGGADAQDWNVYDGVVGTVRVRRDSTSATGFVQAAYRCLRVSYGAYYLDANTIGGLQFDYCRGITGRFYVYNTTIGAVLGTAGTVDHSDLYFDILTYSSVGVQCLSVSYTTLRGRVYGATSAASTFATRLRCAARTITVTGLVFEIDCPYDGNNVRAFRTESGDTGTLTIGTGTCARNCDWSGYASFSVQCDLQIPTANIRGRNFGNGLTAAPANGAWAQFDRVEFNQTAGSTAPGAICITGGSPGTWKTRAVVAA